jgi:hypothetical protein
MFNVIPNSSQVALQSSQPQGKTNTSRPPFHVTILHIIHSSDLVMMIRRNRNYIMCYEIRRRVAEKPLYRPFVFSSAFALILSSNWPS